jgi:hypothetical protein
MKMYLDSCQVIATLLSAFTFIAGTNVYSQSSITIVGPPNGTRITDCETGLLVGDGYTGAVFWAPAGNLSASLPLFPPTMPIIDGILGGGTRAVPAPPNTTAIHIFGVAWETSAGNSYFEALQVFGAKVGRSDTLTVPLDGQPVRIPDFQVCAVPEPSSVAIFALAIALVVGVRRRRTLKS